MTKTAKKDGVNIVLIVVAHTDDEALGLGGTIARHVDCGDHVYGVSMTNGVGARESVEAEAIERRKAALKAAEQLGMQWLEGADFPDNAMDTVPMLSVAKFIEGVKSRICPDIIYTHCAADLNIDHRVVCEATLTAFRPQPNENWTEIRLFEVPSATDFGHRSVTGVFSPNLFIDISSTWPRKAAALREYMREMRPPPHARSLDGLENLARLRGNQAGLQLAEAFEVLRKIVR